jgi:hypothetical protein
MKGHLLKSKCLSANGFSTPKGIKGTKASFNKTQRAGSQHSIAGQKELFAAAHGNIAAQVTIGGPFLVTYGKPQNS